MANRKKTNDKQRYINQTHKTKDRVTQTHLKTQGWTQVLRKSGQILFH
jgi:hypothetical protein